jgi:hypothetical protein
MLSLDETHIGECFIFLLMMILARRTQLDGPQALLTFENDTKGIVVHAEIQMEMEISNYFYFNITLGVGEAIYILYINRGNQGLIVLQVGTVLISKLNRGLARGPPMLPFIPQFLCLW